MFNTIGFLFIKEEKKMKERKKTSELYAIVDSNGNILYSNGGSSHKPKIMTYGKEVSAKRSVSNLFTKKKIKEEEIKILKIYDASNFSIDHNNNI